MSTGPAPSRLAAPAWALFDFANSAYPTVIATFVFSAYVTKAVAPDPITGTTAWGYGMAASGLLIALIAPLGGILADRGGRRLPWLLGFTLACVGLTAALVTIQPDPAFLLPALVLVALSNAAFEGATVFYNALLPAIGTPHALGRLSGWAWGLGYAGGLLCLVVALFGLVLAQPPPFGLDPAQAEPVRASALLVAVWMVVFGWPVFVFVREPRPAAGSPRLGESLRDTLATVRALPGLLRARPGLGWFLLAAMVYTDGINTLFAFGGIYAAGTFDLDMAEIIQFGIALNVTAGIGAALFGWIDDRLGSLATVALGLGGLIVFGTAVLLVDDVRWFLGLAITMGLFFGPVQAASRTWLAREAPADARGEVFGLFALSGRITAFAGPLAVGVLTDLSGSQRVGMGAIIVFLVVGLVLLGVAWKTRSPTP
ncbi:MFS transporter [Pararhodospirillum oryzae]|uniref:MFS transporter n=1 Tax=Pararhodospirillum oryzae TaxID=478448 RepID=A0A512H614_9PROT|nr:MFS transporter [Pararhodospirillum oryzae]GEO80864.1 MFS transporter [Pararhodospirillum oryzae]